MHIKPSDIAGRMLFAVFCLAVPFLAVRADEPPRVVEEISVSEDRALTADELDALKSADELLKTGAGTLSVGEELKDFAGIIRVRQGAYMVSANGALGTTAGATYVEPGAALLLGCTEKDVLKFESETVHIVGSGTEAYPAAIFNVGAQQAYAFKALELDGDATLGIKEDGRRFDVRDGTVKMNGHTLTFDVLNTSQNISFTRTNLKGGGHIVVKTGRFQIEGTTSAGYDWEGDAGNTLTVKKGAYLQRSESKSRIPWTLVLEEGAKMPSLKSTMLNNAAGDDWAGPVQISGRQGNTAVTGPYTDDAPLRFSGCVSGQGIFNWTRGWVMLSNPANAFAGTWSCSRDSSGAIGKVGFVVENTGSVSTVARSIIMKNGAVLSLPSPEPYQLPPLEFDGAYGNVVTGGCGTAVSLLKKGTGMLDFNGRLAVTGTVEIVAGVLKVSGRVPLRNPGLWYGLYKASNVEGDKAGDILWDRTLFMDCVTNSVFFAYQSQADRVNLQTNGCCATYSGYMWNNSPTSETWTITADMTTGSFVYLNDAQAPLQQFASNGRNFRDITVNPGANRLEVRVYRADSWTPYSNDSDPAWPKGLGLAYAIGGGQTDPALFRKFEDPGDGSFLTCDLTPRSELDASFYRVSFANLKFSGGALDLDDREITMASKTLCGHGTVSNGVLALMGEWRLSHEDIASGGIRFCNADVSFGPGFAFDVSGLVRSQIPDGGLVIATFENGEAKEFRRWKSPDLMLTVAKAADGGLRVFKAPALRVVIR